MSKKIIIVTISASVGQFYKSQLYELFGEAMEIVTFSVEKDVFNPMGEADLYIVGTTSADIFDYVMSMIPRKDRVVISNVTIPKKQIDMLRKLPSGAQAMLVNLSANMAIETISDLNRLGITHIKFYPVYPETETIPNIDLAITPGEQRYVPCCVKEIINIGNRIFTANTIIEIALKLDYQWFLKSDKCRNYMMQLAERDYSIETLTSVTESIENKFEILLETMDVGIIGIDTKGIIFACNTLAGDILGKNKIKLIGKYLEELIPDIEGFISQEAVETRNTKLMKLREIYVSMSAAPIHFNFQYMGAFIIMQRFKDEENRQHKFRLQLLDRGYQSRYTFEDIIGECPEIVKAKSIAKKMAKTNSSILLTGESGTGKELFAHSIHNYSSRGNMPFVAINCAALPETLLESELFGYAEGAFTGAKKGGKLGLFEHSHNGTLFLDEIEGMSPNLQVKLLRVLQEKEVMRIGENKIIRIDVRIIAASNENIREKVKKGSFRKDLYYRLNTLPIDIPPLRERGDDIFLIMESIKNLIGADFKLTNSSQDIFRKYYWDGNVRELRNIIEYLKFMETKEIDYKDLPEIMRDVNFETNSVNISPTEESEKFYSLIKYRKEAYEFVLSLLYNIKNDNIGIGRRSICQQAEQNGIGITEQETRTILTVLCNEGLVSVSKGRGGSKITKKGYDFYISTMGCKRG